MLLTILAFSTHLVLHMSSRRSSLSIPTLLTSPRRLPQINPKKFTTLHHSSFNNFHPFEFFKTLNLPKPLPSYKSLLPHIHRSILLHSSSPSLSALSFASQGVLSTYIVSGNEKAKSLAILDTGSNAIVIPLPAFPASLKSFTPISSFSLPVENQNNYKKVFPCPSFVKEGFACSRESYVGVGFNSILGKEIVSFALTYTDNQIHNITTEKGNYYSVSYFMNTLYGGNPNTAIVGIGFSDGIMKKSAIFDKDVETFNYEIKQSEMVASSEGERFNVGTFRTNVLFDRRQYFSAKLKGYKGALAGVGIETIRVVQGNGAERVEITGRKNKVEEKIAEEAADWFRVNRNELAILDSGTNGLLLSGTKFREFAESVLKLNDHGVSVMKDKSGIFYVCWVPNRNYMLKIEFTHFKMEFPLDNVSLMETESDAGNHEVRNCTYVSTMEEGEINVLGYPFWKVFDIVFDAKNMMMHVKKGETCRENCDLAAK